MTRFDTARRFVFGQRGDAPAFGGTYVAAAVKRRRAIGVDLTCGGRGFPRVGQLTQIELYVRESHHQRVPLFGNQIRNREGLAQGSHRAFPIATQPVQIREVHPVVRIVAVVCQARLQRFDFERQRVFG